MILQQVHDLLKEAGSRVMTLTQAHPWMERSVDYIHNHPWISLGVATGVVMTWKFIDQPRDLPPGPFNLPILGAVGFLRQDMHVKLLEVRPTYGDVIYLRLLGNQMVILNSEQAIREALVRRGDEFSDRPKSNFLTAIGFTDDEVFVAHNTAKWKATKKFAITALKTFGLGSERSQEKICNVLEKLDAVLLEQEGQPIDTSGHLKKYAASLAFAVLFNQERPLDDPKFSKISAMTTEWLSELTQGMMMYDFFLPDSQLIKTLCFYRSVKKTRNLSFALIDELKDMVKEHRKDFDATQIKDMMDYYIAYSDMDDEHIGKSLLLILPDGIDAASSQLSWLIFYITKYQDVQKKLQQQIDEQIGLTQMPTISDKHRLPYAEAIVLEMMRCCGLIPMFGPRLLKRDTEFMGYRIPKEATLLPNVHSVHSDPGLFPDPSRFDPSRFLDSDGKVDQAQASRIIQFSIGPRMCIGESYIKAKYFLTLVHLAQKFNVTMDPSVEPSSLPDTSPANTLGPVPHKVCFTPR